MTTIFSRIIAGEIPGTFVHRDDRCVAFMSINPLARGHVLVVPIEEVDHWIDAPPELVAHLFEVTRAIGVAQRAGIRLRASRRDRRRLRGAPRAHPRDPDDATWASCRSPTPRRPVERADSSPRPTRSANGSTS